MPDTVLCLVIVRHMTWWRITYNVTIATIPCPVQKIWSSSYHTKCGALMNTWSLCATWPADTAWRSLVSKISKPIPLQHILVVCVYMVMPAFKKDLNHAFASSGTKQCWVRFAHRSACSIGGANGSWKSCACASSNTQHSLLCVICRVDLCK